MKLYSRLYRDLYNNHLSVYFNCTLYMLLYIRTLFPIKNNRLLSKEIDGARNLNQS